MMIGVLYMKNTENFDSTWFSWVQLKSKGWTNFRKIQNKTNSNLTRKRVISLKMKYRNVALD